MKILSKSIKIRNFDVHFLLVISNILEAGLKIFILNIFKMTMVTVDPWGSNSLANQSKVVL